MYEMVYVYLALISVTDGLHCIVCSSATNVACADSFSGDKSTSSSLSQSDFTSCLVSDNFYTGFFFHFFYVDWWIRKRCTGLAGVNIRRMLLFARAHTRAAVRLKVLVLLLHFIVVQIKTTATARQSTLYRSLLPFHFWSILCSLSECSYAK